MRRTTVALTQPSAARSCCSIPLRSRQARNSRPILAITSPRSPRMSSRAARRRFRARSCPVPVSSSTSRPPTSNRDGRPPPANRTLGAEPLVRFHPLVEHRTRRFETEELAQQKLLLLIIYSSRCKQGIVSASNHILPRIAQGRQSRSTSKDKADHPEQE